MIDRHNPGSALHVLHDDVGMARDESSEMPGDGARACIDAAAWTDYEAIYAASWAWHKMRNEDLSLAFKEIPPE